MNGHHRPVSDWEHLSLEGQRKGWAIICAKRQRPAITRYPLREGCHRLRGRETGWDLSRKGGRALIGGAAQSRTRLDSCGSRMIQTQHRHLPPARQVGRPAPRRPLGQMERSIALRPFRLNRLRPSSHLSSRPPFRLRQSQLKRRSRHPPTAVHSGGSLSTPRRSTPHSPVRCC